MINIFSVVVKEKEKKRKKRKSSFPQYLFLLSTCKWEKKICLLKFVSKLITFFYFKLLNLLIKTWTKLWRYWLLDGELSNKMRIIHTEFVLILKRKILHFKLARVIDEFFNVTEGLFYMDGNSWHFYCLLMVNYFIIIDSWLQKGNILKLKWRQASRSKWKLRPVSWLK